METLEIVVKTDAALGEGLCWDDRTGDLYWVDILGGKIFRYRPAGNETSEYFAGQAVGCVAPREKAGLVCAMQNGVYGFDPKSGGFEKLLDRPDKHLAGNRFNDGKCDPAGRLFAGTMSSDQDKGPAGIAPQGTLYRIDTDLHVKAVLSPVSISNGLAWSGDHKTMYYIDTPLREVSAFDYDVRTGEIGNRRAAVDFRGEAGDPDGMTIDEEDMLWIAHWGGWKISRWNPATGKKLQEISLPCKNVTCCAFGGTGLGDLYITTASVALDGRERKEQPDAGSLFRARTGARGRAACRFKG